MDKIQTGISILKVQMNELDALAKERGVNRSTMIQLVFEEWKKMLSEKGQLPKCLKKPN